VSKTIKLNISKSGSQSAGEQINALNYNAKWLIPIILPRPVVKVGPGGSAPCSDLSPL